MYSVDFDILIHVKNWHDFRKNNFEKYIKDTSTGFIGGLLGLSLKNTRPFMNIVDFLIK